MRARAGRVAADEPGAAAPQVHGQHGRARAAEPLVHGARRVCQGLPARVPARAGAAGRRAGAPSLNPVNLMPYRMSLPKCRHALQQQAPRGCASLNPFNPKPHQDAPAQVPGTRWSSRPPRGCALSKPYQPYALSECSARAGAAGRRAGAPFLNPQPCQGAPAECRHALEQQAAARVRPPEPFDPKPHQDAAAQVSSAAMRWSRRAPSKCSLSI